MAVKTFLATLPRRRSSAIATQAATSPPEEKPITPVNKNPTNFFSLPAEIRNQIYTLTAASQTLTLLSPPPTTRKPTPRHPPSLFLTSHQTRQEYTPIILSLAPLTVHITDYDFRPLTRVIGSLYRTELRALRLNPSLKVLIHLTERTPKKISIDNLRRWAERRSQYLDRLVWRYEIACIPERDPWRKEIGREMKAMRMRREHLMAVEGLQGGVHESLASEVEGVREALVVGDGRKQGVETLENGYRRRRLSSIDRGGGGSTTPMWSGELIWPAGQGPRRWGSGHFAVIPLEGTRWELVRRG